MPLKSARSDHSSFVCNGELIVVGGITQVVNPAISEYGHIPPIEVFRPSTEVLGEWREIEPSSKAEQEVAAMAPRLNLIHCVEPPSQLWLDVSKINPQ